MISQIYKTLEYFITERIPEIKYVSLYNNQFNNPDENRPTPLPGVLIEILPINFENMVRSVQYSQVKVNIHLGSEIYNGFDREDAGQDNSFEHLKLLDKLYVGLNKVNSCDLPIELQSDVFLQGGFRRDTLTLQQYNSVVFQSYIGGSFMLFDSSAVKQYTEMELEDIILTAKYTPNPPFNEDIKTISIKE